MMKTQYHMINHSHGTSSHVSTTFVQGISPIDWLLAAQEHSTTSIHLHSAVSITKEQFRKAEKLAKKQARATKGYMGQNVWTVYDPKDDEEDEELEDELEDEDA